MKTLIAFLFASVLAISAWAAGPVNINTASAEEIAESLNGVGLSKAESIVAYREANGAFLHADELVNVKGIGLKTVDKNREVIQLKDPEPQADS
jgi:competence protein ComEA